MNGCYSKAKAMTQYVEYETKLIEPNRRWKISVKYEKNARITILHTHPIDVGANRRSPSSYIYVCITFVIGFIRTTTFN